MMRLKVLADCHMWTGDDGPGMDRLQELADCRVGLEFVDP